MLFDEYLSISIEPNHNFKDFQHALRYLLNPTSVDHYYSEPTPINIKPDANWNRKEL